MQNTPIKTMSVVLPESRLADYKPQKLNPPVFDVELITYHTPNIALSQTVEVVKRRVWI